MKKGEEREKDRRERLTARMRSRPPNLPSDLDRPHFFQHAGSPVPTLSLHRRTAPAPLRIRGPLTDGRKADRKWRRLALRRQRTGERES